MNIKKVFKFVFVFVMFCCVITNVKADDYYPGIECIYQGKWHTNNGGSNNPNSGNINDAGVNYPYACGIAVKKISGENYKSYLNCQGKYNDGESFVKEISFDSASYDSLFSKSKTSFNVLKNYFGYKEGKGVSKCPKLSFQNNTFNVTAGADTTLNFGKITLGSGMNASEVNYLSKDSSSPKFEEKLRDLIKDIKVTIKDNNGETKTVEEIASSANRESVDDIVNYAKNQGNKKQKYGISANNKVTCKSLLGTENVKLISSGAFLISVIGVVLVVILGSSDNFSKVVL